MNSITRTPGQKRANWKESRAITSDYGSVSRRRARDRGRGEYSLAWHVTSIFTRAVDLFICRGTRERGFSVYRSRLSIWRDDGNGFQLIALMSGGRAECYRVCPEGKHLTIKKKVTLEDFYSELRSSEGRDVLRTEKAGFLFETYKENGSSFTL